MRTSVARIIQVRLVLWFAALGSASACAVDDGDAIAAADKMAAQQAASGKADGRDVCDESGWYGDGICDTFCPRPDPDCGAVIVTDAYVERGGCTPGAADYALRVAGVGFEASSHSGGYAYGTQRRVGRQAPQSHWNQLSSTTGCVNISSSSPFIGETLSMISLAGQETARIIVRDLTAGSGGGGGTGGSHPPDDNCSRAPEWDIHCYWYEPAAYSCDGAGFGSAGDCNCQASGWGYLRCCCPVDGAGGGGGGGGGGGSSTCTNTCRWAHDGVCDDGDAGASFSVCGHGTDCADCPPR
jgi:hypothetical protein